MRILCMVLAAACVAAGFTARAGDDAKDGWVTIHDEKSWKDWKVAPGDKNSKVIDDGGAVKKVDAGDPKKDGSWEFKDGVLHAVGGVSHIFSPRGDYENFQYKAELKISDKGNGGQYFRTDRKSTR